MNCPKCDKGKKFLAIQDIQVECYAKDFSYETLIVQPCP